MANPGSIPCSVCEGDVSNDDEAIYKLAYPEDMTQDDLPFGPDRVSEAAELGVTLEVICSSCRLDSVPTSGTN